MRGSRVPVVKDLILVGGGHAHVTVLRQLGMQPVPGVRVTLICRDLQAPYSGMLPGYIAGHYTFEDAHIDLTPLCRFAGAGFFHDEVVGLDTDNRRLLCRERPALSYDVLSINVGSAPDLSAVPGAAANVTPIKPIAGFVADWRRLRERILQRQGRVRVGIVGAGAGGVELTLAAWYRLENRPEFHLFSDTDDILMTHNRFVRARLRRVLAERNIRVHTGHEVVEVRPGQVRCANGAAFELDEILWVTGAAAQTWPAQAGLDVDEQGFIRVNDTLESRSHEGIFAVGDIAHAVNHPRPKSGVFAVRQGAPLFSNLRNKLLGRPLRPFAPQKAFLSLISTGDKYAVASRSWWALEGRWVWNWKDRIDRRFMRKFNELPGMDTETPQDAAAMRCGGCAAKMGATALQNVLARLAPATRNDVLIGLAQPDDAAVVSVPGNRLMAHTVDFLPSFIDDPYLFGQVAANHALGDLYAMGAEPQTALAIVTLPGGPENRMEELLYLLLRGALKVLNAADTALAGGHTTEGEELSLGFAVNGLLPEQRILRKSGLCAGDQILLTKALGIGALFAARMRCKATGPWIAEALESMLQSNREAARCLLEHGATACTDVSGFGLLGHLLEMIKPAAVGIELDLAALPFLAGARETVADGIFSSLQPQNLHSSSALCDVETVSGDPRYPLLFDPQTSGGLLAGIPAEHAPDCVQALRALGYIHTSIIGRALPQTAGSPPVRLRLQDCAAPRNPGHPDGKRHAEQTGPERFTGR